MLARWIAGAGIVLVASACFGGCLYPDPDDYAGSCRFTGRDDSACGACLLKTCPAAVDALCDGTMEGDTDLQELDLCVPKGNCSSYSFDDPFRACLVSCRTCSKE